MIKSTQRRRINRNAILLPVAIGDMEGVTGLTHDLSLDGCRVNGNLTVRRGQHLTLRLYLPGEDSPLVVEHATVRWTCKKDFGLKFMALSSSERERLAELLRELT